ncbi:MAG: hypothetical protein IBX64_06790 [Actinobacteria bacterium]|nr:hypothetical protein [Actinomycetota bacterium]
MRARKFDSQGKLLKTGDVFEHKDEQGHKVNVRWLGSNDPQGPWYLGRYLISRDAPQKEEVVYEPYLPSSGYHYKGKAVEYYFIDRKVVGFDTKGSMYLLRVIAPDIPIDNDQDIIEKESKTEVWVDVIDLQLGEISSVQLDAKAEKRLGGRFETPHFYAVDSAGNIYQLQVDEQGTKVLKYSRR